MAGLRHQLVTRFVFGVAYAAMHLQFLALMELCINAIPLAKQGGPEVVGPDYQPSGADGAGDALRAARVQHRQRHLRHSAGVGIH